MNRLKFLVYSFLSIAILGLGLNACSDDGKMNNTEAESTDNSVQVMSVPIVNHEYKIVYEGWILDVSLEKENNDYKNTFVFRDTINDEIIFDLDYTFNNSIDGWKYEEQEKALVFANQLKNIGQSNLETLNYMLDEGYNDLFYEVDENNYDEDLFSILAYLRSAVVSNLRMIENGGSEIEGTISPSFLIGESHFIFQEDFYVNLNTLKNNISLLEAEALDSGWQQDMDLVNFIDSSTEEFVTFDVLYSFYISKADFRQHISDKAIYKAGDCSKWCLIGCGSDWGCCSNYSGCCYYSSAVCLAQDILCTDCFDKYVCGPKCKPDGPEGNRPVKIIIAPL